MDDGDGTWGVPGGTPPTTPAPGSHAPPAGPSPTGRELPPPSGQPYDLPPPAAPYGGLPGHPGPAGYAAYAGAYGAPPRPRRRRRTVLVAVTAVTVLVLALAGGTAVLLGRHRAGTTPVAAPTTRGTAPSAPGAPTGTPSPDGPTGTPTSTPSPPTGTQDFAPPPVGPPVASVRATSSTGAMGRGVGVRGWSCVTESDEPVVGSCFGSSGPDDSIRWLGSGDRPDAIRVEVDGGADRLATVLERIPAAIGWTVADRTAAVAAASADEDTVDLPWGTGYLYYRTGDTPSIGLEVERADVTVPADPVPPHALGASLDAVDAVLRQHGYSCARTPATDDDPERVDCSGGGGELTLWASHGGRVDSLRADGSVRVVDDLLSLVAVFGDGPGSDAQAIASLVGAVRDQPFGVVAGHGYLVVCASDAPRSCGVYAVSW